VGLMRIQYPEFNEIKDPTRQLPAGVATDIQNMITRAVARCRTNSKTLQERPNEIWTEVAVHIFNLLTKGRLEQSYPNVESLRGALNEDAAITLACIHWVYRLSYGGRMELYRGHDQIDWRLHEETEEIVTEWWTRKARVLDPALQSPTGELSTAVEDTPETENARLVQAFRERIYRESEGLRIEKAGVSNVHNSSTTTCFPPERRVRKIDISNAAGYGDPTMLRWFEAEAPRLTVMARKNFNRVLSYSADEFWRWADAYQRKNPR
jgi:hypothetical protein